MFCFPNIFLFSVGPLTAPWGSSDRSLKTPVLKYKINSLHQLSASAFPSISPSLEMAGRKWSSLLHKGSHYLLLEVHVIANAHHMDGILVWAPQNPLTITLASHWGPSISSMKRKRKKEVCYSASAKATWEETADWDLALCLGWCHFLLAGQCAPHLHLFPYLFLSRGCCSTWAEASEEALSWGSRSQATNRLTAE